MTERTRISPSMQLEQESTPGSGIQIWRALLHYKLLVIFCTLAGSGLGYLYYLRQPVIFMSGAKILLIKKEANELPVPIPRSRTFEDNLATQMIMLRSPAVIRNAVEKHELASLTMFKGGGDPTGAIVSRLGVIQANEKVNVLDITYSGNNADDCPTVINAVIESYEEFLQESHQNVGKETVELIGQAKETLLSELAKKEDAYREFRLTAPLIWTKEGTLNVHRARLGNIESARSGLIISRSQTKAQLQAIEAAIQRGGSREAILLMMNQSHTNEIQGGSTSRLGIAGQLFPLLLEEQMMLEEHGPEHPKVRNLKKRIEFTRSHLQNLGVKDAEQEKDNPSQSRPVDFLTVYLESLREDIKAIDEKTTELDELFGSEEEAARKLISFEVEDESRRADIARSHQLFEGVVKRLEEISLMQDYGQLKTRVLNPAGRGYQVAPVLSKIMGLGVALGFFAGCGLVFLIELADKRFRSPEELTETLGLPVIGHMPYIRAKKDDETSPIDASVCVYHQPKSSLAEAYRGIRTALYFSTRGDGHKVIQVSSPNPGDGKSTIAVNLAVAIAQSGKKTLLMESDFRKPRVHKLLGLARDVGVTNVISGEIELADGLQETIVENLYAFACGPKPSNPSELLSSPRYTELLAILREKFDYVIVDTPPLMVVTDPAVVAPRVDGILMAVKISKRSRHDVVQSAELLKSLNATILGVVVNGQNQKGRYGYGYAGYAHQAYSYRYQDSQYYNGTYGYGGYGYGEASYSSYYGEDDATNGKQIKGQKPKKSSVPKETG